MAAIEYYFDEMLNCPAATELTRRGYTIVMAIDVGMTEKTDPEHLAYATKHQMILVTSDRKLAGLTAEKSDHSGLICWTEVIQDVGSLVRALSQFADNHTSEEVAGRVAPP